MGSYIDNKLALILASPFIAIFVLSFIIKFAVNFDPPFHSGEKELLRFRPNDLIIKERETVFLKKKLNSPVIMVELENKDIVDKKDVLKNAKNRKIAALLARAKEKNKLKSKFKKVSFILIKSNKDKSAIIDGAVLKEGDQIENAIVMRIEKNRVLIKEGEMGARWLQLE